MENLAIAEHTIFFLNSLFSHNSTADSQLCFRMHLPILPTKVTQKRLSCQSLIKSFPAVSGKWGRCCSKSILFLHKPLLCTSLQKAAVFTYSWERFKPNFVSRMTFNMKFSMKHSFCCMQIAHFRNISTRSISFTKFNSEYSGSCCKCPNIC